MKYRIERRLPFGFRGEWAKCYKLYNYEEQTANQIVEWQKSSYVDIGQDVQVKYLEDGIDKTTHLSQPVMNLPTTGDYRIVKTTDAFFNTKLAKYDCIIGLNDVVFAFGIYWVVDKIEERSIFTPNKQTFFYCGLKRIADEVLIKQK